MDSKLISRFGFNGVEPMPAKAGRSRRGRLSRNRADARDLTHAGERRRKQTTLKRQAPEDQRDVMGILGRAMSSLVIGIFRAFVRGLCLYGASMEPRFLDQAHDLWSPRRDDRARLFNANDYPKCDNEQEADSGSRG